MNPVRLLLAAAIAAAISMPTLASAQRPTPPAGASEAATPRPNPAADSESADEKEVEESRQAQTAGGDYEVTVTATRTATDLRRVGQSVTVLTAEDLDNAGARDLLQALEGVAGFNVVRNGSFGGAASVFVRGGENDFNLVLIDGVQVNQPGGAFDFGDLTLTNVERIEIVRGPASVLYGADAVTSTINIITRRGEGPPSGVIGVEGGSFGGRLLRAGFRGASERAHYSLGAHYSRTDGIYSFNNEYRKGELSFNGGFQVSSSAWLTANVRYSDSEYGFPTEFTGEVLDPNDFRTTQEGVYSVSYEQQLSGRWGAKLQYGHHQRDFRNFTLFDGVSDFFDSTFASEENRHYLDFQNNVRLNQSNLLTAGVSYEREAIADPQLNRRSVGFYVQDQMELSDRLSVTAGIRYDDNNRFDSFLTGSFSAAWRIGDEWRARASFGNGFRSPAFAEIIGFPAFGIVGNPDLSPEKNVAVDFGVDFAHRSRRAGVSATVFFNKFSDLIEFSFLVPPGVPNYINVERARSRGLELEGFASPVESLRVGANYTFAPTRVTDTGTVAGDNFQEGESLLRRPRHAGAVFAEWVRGGTRFRIDFKYKGRRDDVRFFPDFTNARVSLPSYWKTDFGATIPVAAFSKERGEVALVFRGENVFDRSYTEVAGFDSPGRSLFGGVEVRF